MIITIILSLFTTLTLANLNIDSSLTIGAKFPNSISEGSNPIYTKAITPSKDSFKGGFNDLLKYVLPAPDQEDAGSCLFMSLTGNVEWWHSKISGDKKTSEKRNLSERYFMNLSKEGLDDDLDYWPTDMIYALNKRGDIFKNSDYRYAKGWFKKVESIRVPALKDEEGAKYGISYSWMSMYQDIKAPSIKLPEFAREVIFKDPKANRWNVTTAPKDIVSRIKNALHKRKAPVLVIYNHVGYWHANLIVGYNDTTDSMSCPFVSKYDELMNKRADEIERESQQEENEKLKKKLARKAKKFRKRGNQVKISYKNNGGCNGSGVFYVRDSIYPNKKMPMYDYDLSQVGEEKHLNANVILREYEWAENLLNHAIQIYPL